MSRSSAHGITSAAGSMQADRPSKAALAIARLCRTPLAQRMVQDMTLVGFGERTQESYLRAVSKLAEYFRCSPEKLNEEPLRE